MIQFNIYLLFMYLIVGLILDEKKRAAFKGPTQKRRDGLGPLLLVESLKSLI